MSLEHPRSNPDRAGIQLFALSFAALFLELMLIRWVPAVVMLVSYYANLMLISSFLGLGIGAMLASRPWKLLRWFPLLLLGDLALLLACDQFVMPGSASESRFYQADVGWLQHFVVIAIFAANTILFLPLGQRIGELFGRLPPLRAYSWDLGGSLCGTITFAAFSLLHFSAVVGLLVVLAVYLTVVTGRVRWWNLAVVPLVVWAATNGTDRNAVWSPYHYVTIREAKRNAPTVSAPPADVRTRTDPPVYEVAVGRNFYQHHGTLELSRYTPQTPPWLMMRRMREQYLLPYHFARRLDRVVVCGAGGGLDVEAALMAGATRVDAVDIDPSLIEISRRISASGVYDDPRVAVRIDDARVHLRAMPSGSADMIVFGLLDSQALFSYMANLRLDGYIYTVESMRTAFEKLASDGVLSLTFYCGQPWLAPKLALMLREGTGIDPIVYRYEGWYVLLIAKGDHPIPPPRFGDFELAAIAPRSIDLPTDDWPYLYLSTRTIPGDYLIVIGALVVLSAIAVFAARGTRFAVSDVHFFFLGMGFLLLQTKSITDCSLFFGTTWLVSNIVIAGVLLMVLAANLIAMRIKGGSTWFYWPLLASLLVLYLMPRDLILSWPMSGRLAWALLIVPLPIFFAGLIFSTTFRLTTSPSQAFGANLIGATIGGFAEYLGMALGTQALSLIVIGAYLASRACVSFTTAATMRPRSETGGAL